MRLSTAWEARIVALAMLCDVPAGRKACRVIACACMTLCAQVYVGCFVPWQVLVGVTGFRHVKVTDGVATADNAMGNVQH